MGAPDGGMDERRRKTVRSLSVEASGWADGGFLVLIDDVFNEC